ALPDPVPHGAARDAEDVLRRLGAIDAEGRATDLGRRLAEVPAEPRLARALLDGAALVGVQLDAEVDAALADDHRPSGADLTALLRSLRAGRAPGSHRWSQEVRRLRQLADRHTDVAPVGAPGARASSVAGEESGSEGAVPAADA